MSVWFLGPLTFFDILLFATVIILFLILIFLDCTLKSLSVQFNSPSYAKGQLVKFTNYQSSYEDSPFPSEIERLSASSDFLKRYEINKTADLAMEIRTEGDQVILKETWHITTNYRKSPAVNFCSNLSNNQSTLVKSLQCITRDSNSFERLFTNTTKFFAGKNVLFLKSTHRLDGQDYLVLVFKLPLTELKTHHTDMAHQTSTLFNLKHPNILNYKSSWIENSSVFEDNDQNSFAFFSQFDFFKFVTVSNYLKIRRKVMRTHVVGIFLQIIEALLFLEARVDFHLPIGLSNILIDSGGNVKLVLIPKGCFDENSYDKVKNGLIEYDNFVDLSEVILNALMGDLERSDKDEEFFSFLRCKKSGKLAYLIDEKEFKNWAL